MRITTWNVNSIRARAHRVPEVIDRIQPDVLCLQEIKCEEEDFPVELFGELGYDVEIFGQKTYNGVAIAAKAEMTEVKMDFPIPGDGQSRGISAVVEGVRIVDLYVVNGKEVGHEYYDYKLKWLDALAAWLEENARPEEPLVVCGDFNIAPDDRDVWDVEEWRDKVLCSAAERARLQRLFDWGLTDAFRLFNQDSGRYVHTWWDFRGNGFGRGHGLRIDHHLISQPLVGRARAVEIDREARKGFKPSDHAPVTLVLE